MASVPATIWPIAAPRCLIERNHDAVDVVGRGHRLLGRVEIGGDFALGHARDLRLDADDDLRRAVGRVIARLEIAHLGLEHVVGFEPRRVAVDGE